MTENLPKHAWLWVHLPEGGTLLAYTYQERTEGWAARGVSLGVPGEPSGDELYRLLEQPDRVFRPESSTGEGARLEPVTEAEAARLGLPAQPEWLAFFEAPTAALVTEAAPPVEAPAKPAPMTTTMTTVAEAAEAAAPAVAVAEPVTEAPEAEAATPAPTAEETPAPAATPIVEDAPPAPKPTPWRTADGFAGRFHPQHEDDIEALFFFPTQGRAERIWVRLSSEDPEGHGYRGVLLNTPSSPSELAEGSEVTVRSAPGLTLPVYLTPTMRENLRRCTCRCQGCGFDLLMLPLDAILPQPLPQASAGTAVLFTYRCPACGKTMMIELKAPLTAEHDKDRAPVITTDESRAVMLAALAFGAFLFLSILLWYLRPLATP